MIIRSPDCVQFMQARADEVGVVGEQRAGEPAQRAGDDEADELVAVGREADRARARLVRAYARITRPKREFTRR